jgi:hypothetical protein
MSPRTPYIGYAAGDFGDDVLCFVSTPNLEERYGVGESKNAET